MHESREYSRPKKLTVQLYLLHYSTLDFSKLFWLNLTINYTVCTLVGELLYLKLIIPFLQSCLLLLAHTTVFSAHSNSNKTQTSKMVESSSLYSAHTAVECNECVVTWKCNYLELVTVPCRIQMSVNLILQKGVALLRVFVFDMPFDKAFAFRQNWRFDSDSTVFVEW